MIFKRFFREDNILLNFCISVFIISTAIWLFCSAIKDLRGLL